MMDGMPAIALCSHIKSVKYGNLKNECVDDVVSSSSSVPAIQNIFERAFASMNDKSMYKIQKSSEEG